MARRGFKEAVIALALLNLLYKEPKPYFKWW